jgi:hypothetical protein
VLKGNLKEAINYKGHAENTIEEGNLQACFLNCLDNFHQPLEAESP